MTAQKLRIGAVALAFAAHGFAQAPTIAPAFEVASLKHGAPRGESFTVTFDDHRPGQIHYANTTLKDLLTRAYDVEDYQLEGPAWLDTETYQIAAKAPPNTSQSMRMLMLQTLLAERLGVKVHHEKREMMAFVLQVGKSAPTLQAAKEGPKINADGSMAPLSESEPGRLRINKQSMEGLANILAATLRTPVVDMTGIKGEFNLTLEWKPDDGADGKGAPGGALDRVLPDSVFVALQEKTGLLLKKQKAPVDVLVIDHAERTPTEN